LLERIILQGVSDDLQFVGRPRRVFDARRLAAAQYRIALVKRALING